MARKSSVVEGLIKIVASSPWWMGLAPAMVSFLVLHGIAGIEVDKPAVIDGLGTFAGKQLYISLARFGQFLLPLTFGLGSLVSFLKGRKRKALFEGVQKMKGEDPLFALTWREFEMVVGESFRRRGYQVQETGGEGPQA